MDVYSPWIVLLIALTASQAMASESYGGKDAGCQLSCDFTNSTCGFQFSRNGTGFQFNEDDGNVYLNLTDPSGSYGIISPPLNCTGFTGIRIQFRYKLARRQRLLVGSMCNGTNQQVCKYCAVSKQSPAEWNNVSVNLQSCASVPTKVFATLITPPGKTPVLAILDDVQITPSESHAITSPQVTMVAGPTTDDGIKVDSLSSHLTSSLSPPLTSTSTPSTVSSRGISSRQTASETVGSNSSYSLPTPASRTSFSQALASVSNLRLDAIFRTESSTPESSTTPEISTTSVDFAVSVGSTTSVVSTTPGFSTTSVGSTTSGVSTNSVSSTTPGVSTTSVGSTTPGVSTTSVDSTAPGVSTTSVGSTAPGVSTTSVGSTAPRVSTTTTTVDSTTPVGSTTPRSVLQSPSKVSHSGTAGPSQTSHKSTTEQHSTSPQNGATSSTETPRTSTESLPDDTDVIVIIVASTLAGTAALIILAVIILLLCLYRRKINRQPETHRVHSYPECLPKTLSQLYYNRSDGGNADLAAYRVGYETGVSERNGPATGRGPRDDFVSLVKLPPGSSGQSRSSTLSDWPPEELRAPSDHLHDVLRIHRPANRGWDNESYRASWYSSGEAGTDCYEVDPHDRGHCNQSKCSKSPHKADRSSPHRAHHSFEAEQGWYRSDCFLPARVDEYHSNRRLPSDSGTFGSAPDSPRFTNSRNRQGQLELGEINNDNERNRPGYWSDAAGGPMWMSAVPTGIGKDRGRQNHGQVSSRVAQASNGFTPPRRGHMDAAIALDPRLEPGVVIIYSGQHYAENCA